jgi:hypothetical protein
MRLLRTTSRRVVWRSRRFCPRVKTEGSTCPSASPAPFGDGGKTIAARWEISHDGKTWEHDFDITYTKQNPGGATTTAR